MSDAPAIYKALAAVMADVQAVAKRDRNSHANYNFRGIDAVMNAVGPALREHKVVVFPQVHDVAYEQVQTSTGKPATACRVRVNYLFCAQDGSHLEASVAGEAWDSGDKACPKAMSVAFRTALLQSLCLPTDEPDPDTHTYERAAVDPQTAAARALSESPFSDDQFPAICGLYHAGATSTSDLSDDEATKLTSNLASEKAIAAIRERLEVAA